MKARTIYTLLAFALGVLACMAATVGITISVIEHAERKQQIEARRATCAIVRTMLAVYQEDTGEPVTEIRQNVIDAWTYIGQLAKC